MGQFTMESKVFKNVYGKRSENYYNSANVTTGRIKKNYKFKGKQKILDAPTSFGGGVGSGRLPTAGKPRDLNPIITSHKIYGVCEIEREAIKAADGDEGSFVSQTKFSVTKTVESWNRNLSRMFWNELDNGELGLGDNSTAVTGLGTEASPYLVIMSATGWKEANWEEEDYVNCGTETSLLLVYEVVTATRQIKFVGTSATLAAAVAGATATAAKFYMQNSKDNDITSLASVLDATSGTLYGLTVARRFQASVQQASTSAGITTDFLNQDMLDVQRKCGQVPNLIITSFTQYRKLLNLIEDKKEYIVEPRSENLKGNFSFKGLAFQSAAGLVPIFPERFIADDRVYYLNDNFIEMHHRPDFGWFDDDGSVFMRKADDDAYEARYGGYMELMVEPVFHGVRTGLAV